MELLVNFSFATGIRPRKSQKKYTEESIGDKMTGPCMID